VAVVEAVILLPLAAGLLVVAAEPHLLVVETVVAVRRAVAHLGPVVVLPRRVVAVELHLLVAETVVAVRRAVAHLGPVVVVLPRQAVAVELHLPLAYPNLGQRY
jgi:hypothetical protein